MSILGPLSKIACIARPPVNNSQEESHHQSVMKIIAQAASAILSFFRDDVPEKAVELLASLKLRLSLIPVIPRNVEEGSLGKSELSGNGAVNEESYTNFQRFAGEIGRAHV